MSGLAQHREALRLEMEAAIRNSEPNPTRAVERASLAIVPASSEDTTTTPSTSMLAEIPPTKSKKSEKSKGKDVVPSTPKMKGAREVSEIEVPRKKSSQGSRQATATEFEGHWSLLSTLWKLANYLESFLRTFLMIDGQGKV